ncbi:D-inositol-3-phosphate glycosyltransferase [Novipirellula aureliae]|uniref:D-inositol-3-phosphate glycosyltransferase n=1 Tax=Novipirellula aureliae TaxID=2527966 RepID=A0A5C6DLF7_9BACT|nr:glycosyltransferase [Novipirellula aureliae]TWU37650.1 D-inositol-3-phosphate glycosyltransferase [Novipirellula aureliae]
MRVLVFEHSFKVGGHRLPYASKTASAFEGSDVLVALPSQLSGDESICRYFKHENVHFYEANPTSGALSNAIEAGRCLVRLVKRVRPDLVVIPTADGLATMLGMMNLLKLNGCLRQINIDACLMKPQIGRPTTSMLRNWTNQLKWWITTKGPWQRLLLIDPLAWSAVKNSKASRIFLCPDPVPTQFVFDKTEARLALGLPSAGRMIVSVGGQDRRKGTDLLLRAFEVARFADQDRLVLIGKISDEIRPQIQVIQQNSVLANRLIIIDRYISEDEFQQAIIASDLVAMPYRSTDRPSGIACRCLAWGRPVIATNSGWLKWVVDDLGAGFAADPLESKEFANMLEHALDQCDRFSLTTKGQSFVEYNSEQNYAKVWRNEATRLQSFFCSANGQSVSSQW